MGAFWDEFEDAHIEVDEFIDAGDQVLAALTVQWRGKGITSRDEALEAVGLSE